MEKQTGLIMQSELEGKISSAREDLFSAVKLSRQASYHRRAPEPECLPHYAEAKRLLGEVLQQHPKNREALMMMSQISEGLMDFGAAIDYLDRAFESGEPKTKKTLKRLALLRENSDEWYDLRLTPEMLRDLGDYLDVMCVNTNHRTLELTRNWLLLNEIDNPDEVIASIERRGAFSDFQVLANLVMG